MDNKLKEEMTKTTEIQTNGRTLVVVPVPSDYNNFEVHYSPKGYAMLYWNLKNVDNGAGSMQLSTSINEKPKFNLLGYLTKDEISFDCSYFVEREDDSLEFNFWKNYIPNHHPIYDLDTPEQSFRSLLESHNILFTNKFGKHPMERDIEEMDIYVGNGRYAKRKVNMKPNAIPESCLKEWNEAQSHVIEKCVILEKI